MTLGDISQIHRVDALVVAVAHAQYRMLTPESIRSMCSTSKTGKDGHDVQPVVADLKSLYDRHELAAQGLTVFRL